ncbi:MAG: TonB family protein, partial [Candidatus Tumulicola sp.]
VALGEASDAERDAYRRHLSGCRRCVSALGGERDIERTMQVVASARDGEGWEPDVRVALRDRVHAKRYAWRVGLSTLAAAVLVSIGVHAFVAAGVKRIGVTTKNPIVIGYDGQKIVLERRLAPPVRPVSRAATVGHDVIIVHNVVTLKRPRLTAPVPAARNAVPPARAAVPPGAQHHSKSPSATVIAALSPSQRDKRSVAALRTSETAPPPAQRAESIAVAPSTVVIRDVFPLGGENAIVPRPASIAYYENAEGTTAVDVSVDARGLPVKCTITKASGYLVLDEAVCRAAMHARYSPRSINGRAVSSLYHDAFTFRSGADDQ